jgi:hypothetical protein
MEVNRYPNGQDFPPTRRIADERTPTLPAGAMEDRRIANLAGKSNTLAVTEAQAMVRVAIRNENRAATYRAMAVIASLMK